MNYREELRESTENRIAKAFNVDMANAGEYHKRKVHNTAVLIVHDVLIAFVKRFKEKGLSDSEISKILDIPESTISKMVE